VNGGPVSRWRFMREHRWTGNRLSDYLEDELSELERLRLERHTGLCPQCRRVLATLQRTVRELAGLRDEPTPGVAEGAIDRLRRTW